MNKKIVWLIIILLGIVLIVGVLASKQKTTQQANTSPIKIGVVLSLTGFAGPWGEYAKNGIDLAVKTINDAGGIEGRQVQVIVEDDATDGKKAVSAFSKLRTVDGVQGIIGGVFDFTAQPLLPLAHTNQIALISPSNFRIDGGFDLNDQSFVMLTDFHKTIFKIKPYIASSTIKKLAVVHYQSTFGTEIAKTLDGVMKDLGHNGIIDSAYPQIGKNDWKTTILKLKGQGVDAVFIDMVGNDPVTFLRQAKQLGFSPTIITYNGVQDALGGNDEEGLLEGVVVLNWEVSTPEFAGMYQKAYGVPPTKSADKYFEAVYVMAQALAHTTNPSQVASFIVSNQFATPNGIVSFTSDHAVLDVPVEIQVFKEGVQVPLW